jgi:hypothetical protein
MIGSLRFGNVARQRIMRGMDYQRDEPVPSEQIKVRRHLSGWVSAMIDES